MSLPPYDQSIRDFERQFQVVLPDAVGQATVGFREGVWYRLNSGAPHPVPIRSAIILCPHAAGSIVQIACWWMRENSRSPRALDLATELALTVGELARKAIEDDPLGMSLHTLSTSSVNAASSLGTSGSSFAGAGVGSLGSSGGYDSGSYSTDPYASAAQPTPSYEPAYAAAPPAAATTLLPQITPDMTARPGARSAVCRVSPGRSPAWPRCRPPRAARAPQAPHTAVRAARCPVGVRPWALVARLSRAAGIGPVCRTRAVDVRRADRRRGLGRTTAPSPATTSSAADRRSSAVRRSTADGRPRGPRVRTRAAAGRARRRAQPTRA